jgi:8-oxo-dGTP pyrophosphatase MutT (NUDIX family)
MASELKVGEMFATLKIEEIYNPNDHYKMIRGKNMDGETRQLVTRGPGKNLAATRIPIQIPAYLVDDLSERLFRQDEPEYGFKLLRDFFRGASFTLRTCNLESVAAFNVLLVKMPREGNPLNGFEWNAPGGTGEPGESLDEIAEREFSEESDLTPLFTWSPFPPMQFASGIYDEIQKISFVFVAGNPKKLVEGAREWKAVPVMDFHDFAHEMDRFYGVFVDGKVTLAVLYLAERLMSIV